MTMTVIHYRDSVLILKLLDIQYTKQHILECYSSY